MSIKILLNGKAADSPHVRDKVALVERDLNAMLAFNPEREGLIFTKWNGKQWLVYGQSYIRGHAPSLTTDYIQYADKD